MTKEKEIVKRERQSNCQRKRARKKISNVVIVVLL